MQLPTPGRHGASPMKEPFEVQSDAFSINLTFAVVLPFAVAIAVPLTAVFAQTPESAIPEKAPPGWNADQQQFWPARRNACIALAKKTAEYRAMTPAQQAKLPKMSKLQAREGYEQWEDCARMAPHPDFSHMMSPPKKRGRVARQSTSDPYAPADA